MEYMQLQDFTIVLLGICALIAAISGASAAVVKFWRYAHKDSEANTEQLADHERRISSLENCCKDVQGKLQSDWRYQQEQTEVNRMVLKSLKSLLQHAVDGNDTDKLEQREQEIDRFLFDHMK